MQFLRHVIQLAHDAQQLAAQGPKELFCHRPKLDGQVTQIEKVQRLVHGLDSVVIALQEILLGKIAQEDDSIFSKLVRSDRFQQELKESLEALKKDPAQFTDLYEAYRQQKTA